VENYTKHEIGGGINWYFLHGSASTASTSDIKSSDQKEGSVYTSGTYLIGGDPAAKSGGDFCHGIGTLQTPRVIEFQKLLPIWDYFGKIDGVSADAGDKLKEYTLKFWEAGDQCAATTCGGTASMCSWHSQSRSWSEPCTCLSQAVLQTTSDDDVLKSLVFNESGGHTAHFPGWAIAKDQFQYQYGMDWQSDCMIWDDGTLGRERAPEFIILGFVIPTQKTLSLKVFCDSVPLGIFPNYLTQVSNLGSEPLPFSKDVLRPTWCKGVLLYANLTDVAMV